MSIYISKINEIFQNCNIYKSIFIIHESVYDELVDDLQRNDYPICVLNDIQKFTTTNARILLVNSNVYHSIGDVLDNILINEVSIVICIGCSYKCESLQKVEHIFL